MNSWVVIAIARVQVMVPHVGTVIATARVTVTIVRIEEVSLIMAIVSPATISVVVALSIAIITSLVEHHIETTLVSRVTIVGSRTIYRRLKLLIILIHVVVWTL